MRQMSEEKRQGLGPRGWTSYRVGKIFLLALELLRGCGMILGAKLLEPLRPMGAAIGLKLT